MYKYAILRFALDKLRVNCPMMKRKMNGASQQAMLRITDAGYQIILFKLVTYISSESHARERSIQQLFF